MNFCLGPLMTQAWIKFYEILSNFPQLSETNLDYEPQLSSLHLCEAPGAFISALLQYCAGKEMLPPNWMAATLNPWHEESSPGAVINLDSLILAFPDRWIFGRDNTGDIFDKVGELTMQPIFLISYFLELCPPI
jgi:cap2 methyltransferase